MDTVPHSAPQDNPHQKKAKIYYDGRKSNLISSRGDTDIVYGMVDPRDQRVFYIGITNDLYLRFKQHMLMTGSNERKKARILAILDAKMLPWMLTLEVVDLTVSSARAREIAHIQAYVDAGYELLNDEVQSEVTENSDKSASEVM